MIQGANGSPRFPSTVSQNSTQARRKPYLSFSLLCNNFFIPLGSAEEVEARQRAPRWMKIFLLVNTTHSQKPCGTWKYSGAPELPTRVPTMAHTNHRLSHLEDPMWVKVISLDPQEDIIWLKFKRMNPKTWSKLA